MAEQTATYAFPCFLLMTSHISRLSAKLGSKRAGLHARSTQMISQC
jgi:hypothetical protein